MNLFPVNLNIYKKVCTVIGGGKVAERKIFHILPYEPIIKVISLEFTPKILELSNYIKIIKSSYDKKYLVGSFLVFICTDNKELNLKIYNHAKELNVLVNIVTHPDLCDFSIPSVVKRGDLQIAISTNGKSPALTKIIRKEIQKQYGEEYEQMLIIMEKIRKKQLECSKDSSKNKELFYRFLDNNIIDLLKNREFNKIKEIIKLIFDFEIEPLF